MKTYSYTPSLFELPGNHFPDLWAEIPWERREDSPRNECWFALDGRSYTYGKGRGERTYHSKTHHSDALPEFLLKIWLQVEHVTGSQFKGCFINGYKDGSDHLGWHDDDGPDLDHGSPIAVVSFGSTREIWVKENPIKFTTADGVINLPDINPPDKISLESGSLFVMNAGMQKTHQHRIPKSSDFKCGPRISLTFRGLK